MSSQEIADTGASLAVEIDQLAAQYHVKSDEYDILSWEADIIRAKSKGALENCGLVENLRESTLLSTWGANLAESIPNIANKVRDFHASYNSVKKCT
ncbi:hypothetical protein [Pseudomonas anguilliseptica]|uniref:hypothetical protein n=1 Tax=Pseudomonas anguilliseptica TaxID=53406 RepID=UPI0022AEAE84|nr:hypothetical protein [Pseudomonas anguilliseptica]MCZ4324571.1 hypothetical protein [Pseudomonas anguilliseptica]